MGDSNAKEQRDAAFAKGTSVQQKRTESEVGDKASSTVKKNADDSADLPIRPKYIVSTAHGYDIGHSSVAATEETKAWDVDSNAKEQRDAAFAKGTSVQQKRTESEVGDKASSTVKKNADDSADLPIRPKYIVSTAYAYDIGHSSVAATEETKAWDVDSNAKEQ